MNLKSIIFIIINILFVHGLDINPLEPGILMEKYGETVSVEKYLNVAVKFKFSAFNIEELTKTMSIMEKLCKMIEVKFEDEHPLCQDQVQHNKAFINEINEKFGYLQKFGDINSGGTAENLEVKDLKTFEFTEEISNNLATKIDQISTYINSTLDKVSKISGSLTVKAGECTERIVSISFKFEDLRSYFKNKLSEIERIIDSAAKLEVSPLLLSTGFKDMLKSIKVEKHRQIIDFDKMDFADFKVLSKVAVHKDDKASYIILSLPMTAKQNDSYELIQLRPIPKLEDNILTFINLEANFIVRNENSDGSYVQLENLNDCKYYDNKYYCDNLNFIHKPSNSCIALILKNHRKDNLIEFSNLSSCKLSAMAIFANIAIKLHAKNSYLAILSKKAELSFNSGLRKITKGIFLIHENKPGSIEIDGIELNFHKDFHDAGEFQVMSEVQAYSYSSPKHSQLFDLNRMDFRRITSPKLSSFEELNELSTDVECLSEKFLNNMANLASMLIIVFGLGLVAFVLIYHSKVHDNFRKILKMLYGKRKYVVKNYGSQQCQ
ncbi:unnamed protein product [Chironomus riparius]|uniref:Envelope protein n=1 Tax=Chironomus riparius TaxID=315576 RepID=A0A9N9RTS7_9DIPT|nr:unnamed protein product [Chironomus riparius]